jgi:hypothetical protein
MQIMFRHRIQTRRIAFHTMSRAASFLNEAFRVCRNNSWPEAALEVRWFNSQRNRYVYLRPFPLFE